ncbi:MAG: hypothetical protein Q8P44_07455 [Dehalococcoidia bacterium]|nr:hypothetical protein [Dehalococcoidia bacterium]
MDPNIIIAILGTALVTGSGYTILQNLTWITKVTTLQVEVTSLKEAVEHMEKKIHSFPCDFTIQWRGEAQGELGRHDERLKSVEKRIIVDKTG